MSDDAPLWEDERHEPQTDLQWSETLASRGLARIVDECLSARGESGGWVAHREDSGEPADRPVHIKHLYAGSAGVVWALEHLRKLGWSQAAMMRDELEGHVESNRKVMRRWLANTSGYLVGDAGIYMTRFALAATRPLCDAVYGAIGANVGNASADLMVGAPGTTLAALHMFERTGEARFEIAFRQGAAALLATRVELDDGGPKVWPGRLPVTFGAPLGAVHGFAGNAFPLLRGQSLLSEAERVQARQTCADTALRTAVSDGRDVNWPQMAYGKERLAGRSGSGQDHATPLLQVCHGAPGIVLALAPAISDATSDPLAELLLRAGETIWSAGPLRKAHGLCHGTAGSGYALLRLYTLNRDPVWLERARRFAMHALAQSDREAERAGMRRWALWTGDLGLACFLADCLEAACRFPTLDVF